MKKIYILLIIITQGVVTLRSQTVLNVQDSTSLEPIIGASVKSLSSQWSGVSDEYGRLLLNKSKGNQYEVNYPGYVSDTVNISFAKPIEVSLLKGYILETVVISADNTKSPIENLSVVSIPIERIKQIPQLAGEADIMKSLALLPGISNGNDGTSGLLVRGGTPDQNLILLDDAPTYNLNHFLGYVSAVNPDAVSNVNLYPGPIPARYGNRLSSVIDIGLKEGNKTKWNKNVSIGLISSHFNLNGPLSKKMSINFSTRLNYLGLILLPRYISYKSAKGDANYQNLFMYDLNFKFTYNISKRDKLNVGFYSGKDFLIGLGKSLESNSSYGLNWGNDIAMLRFNRLWTNNISTKVILTKNIYNYLFRYQIKDKSNTEYSSFRNRSNVNDISARLENIININPDLILKFGTDLNTIKLVPSRITQSLYGKETLFGDTTYNLLNFNAYMELDYEWNKFLFSIGARMSKYLNIGINRFYYQPRLSLGYSINTDKGLLLSLSNTTQAIHSVVNYNSVTENELWLPSTNYLKPEVAKIYTLGYFDRKFINNKTFFKVNLYYKLFYNQIDYLRDGDRFNIFNSVSQGGFDQQFESQGNGKSYGIELLMDKTFGNFNGWIAYSYGRTFRKFDKINNGTTFRGNFDRPHNVSLVGSYVLNDRWSVSSVFIFQSGRPVTLPTGIMLDENNQYSYIFDGRNNERMPAYHRLDVGLKYSREGKRGIVDWNFGLFNAYARRNPNSISIRRGFNSTGNDEIFVNQNSIFQFIPSFSYAYRWK